VFSLQIRAFARLVEVDITASAGAGDTGASAWEIVEPRRIVSQDAPPRRLVRRPLLEQLEQAPGIGHLALDPGCGQSLPQTRRSGLARTSASWNGRASG
jgi:hypothetical protein